MTLEDAYRIVSKDSVHEHEACDIIAYYVKLLKNKIIVPRYPSRDYNDSRNSLQKLTYRRNIGIMFQMYEKASTFIKILHDAPETVRVKVHM